MGDNNSLEVQKQEGARRKGLILLLLFACMLVLVGYIFYDLNQYSNMLSDEIDRKDKLISEIRTSDSLIFSQKLGNEKKVEKYISGCNILIDGKEVSTEQLVTYLNKLLGEINSLNEKVLKFEDSLDNCRSAHSQDKVTLASLKQKFAISMDSLSIYKTFYDLAKKNLLTDFFVRNDDSLKRRTVTIKLPPQQMDYRDSFFIYKTLYNRARLDYEVNYKYSFKDGVITTESKSDKLDSALVLFEYYKNRLKKDKNGDWLIKTPWFYKKPKS